MKLLPYVAASLLLITFFTQTQDYYQYSTETYYTHDSMLDNNLNLYAPVKFTSTGITSFLHDIFNNPLYSTELLPHNFTHLIQFLEYGKKTKQQRAYIKSVIRLFTNKMKATTYVDASAFDYQVLKEIPMLLGEYFLIFKQTQIDSIKELVNELLYSSFLNKFSSFQANPKDFLTILSEQIIQTIDTSSALTKEVSVEELRKGILIFLEISINKLMWHSSEQEKTWESVKNIANNLSVLMEYNIIPDPDDLNDLFVTLIERYCYFLEIVENDLSVEFYEKIKSDICANSIILFEQEEADEFAEKKSQRLIRTLAQGEAKARWRTHTITIVEKK